MIDAAALTRLVEAWMPRQRWYAGKGRNASVRLTELAELGRGVELWIATAHYDDGETESYQLPLIAHDAPAEHLDHVLLGTIDEPTGPRWVYDALHDKDVTPAFLEAIRDGARRGPVQFNRRRSADEIPVDQPSLVLTVEQTNTSLMFGDTAMLKVFRRLQPGLNPDIEVHIALGDYDARHIARVLGDIEADIDGQTVSLGMVQEYLTTATDGWDLAKASVRDLMAERDLHAEEAGADFAADAYRLGVAVAETHTDLAAVFGTSTISGEDVRARVDAMHARLDSALGLVSELGEIAPAMHEAYEKASSEPVVVQRIHGDLHLGQVLRTAYRWVLIDFEGEPMVDMQARRAPDSPLRDVAGMLRSFGYAGHYRLVETGVDPNDTQLAYRADEWTARNQSAFCDGYASVAERDPRDEAVWLRAFQLDKGVYEAVYEARNRPSWLPIPLASLRSLAGGTAVPS